MDASADSLNPYDIPDDGAQWPVGDFSGSQVRRGGPPGLPATCSQGPRVDQYVQQCVADAVERAVAIIEGKVEALKARVDNWRRPYRRRNREPHAVKSRQTSQREYIFPLL